MKVIATEKAPKALGPYSQGYVHNGILYSAGQIAINPATDAIEATDIEGQTKQVCENLAALLEAAGTSFDKVLKTTCFLADMGDFAAFNEVYAKFFTSKPARSCVAVKTLPKNVLCEVELIAAVEEQEVNFKMAEKENNSTCSAESCSSCAQAGSCPSKKVDMKVPANEYTHVKKVIGVVSGKGGVGKSMVTASLARLMRQQGYSVGILDADITGPSIPKMYGIHEHAVGNDDGLFPCIAQDETRIMSINLLLETEDTPVIWRGPIIAGVVKQFWEEVLWGDLDYLFVDMPPGTGDVPLTVFQSLPLDGVVIVTSPQDLVQMIVKKAFYMARQMNIPVLGIVENYSYLQCPDCGKKISVFGESHIDEIAAEMGVEVLGKMPIDPQLAEMVEAEKFYEVENDYLKDAVEALA